jgi:hypothetical protein
MKTMLKIFMMLMLASPSFAQEDQDDINQNEKMRDKVKAARAAFITERLELSPDEAEKFWPVYREYSDKRQSLRHLLMDARKSKKNGSELLELDLKLRQQELDLEKHYSERFLKTISAEKVIKLREAEDDFKKLVLRQIQKRRHQQERKQHERDRSQKRK